jgi:hypothetical protein
VTVSNFTRAERFGPDEGYVGARTIHTYTAAGPRIDISPAMPPRDQYTETHEDNR